jgi:hypothetical protein
MSIPHPGDIAAKQATLRVRAAAAALADGVPAFVEGFPEEGWTLLIRPVGQKTVYGVCLQALPDWLQPK